MLDGQVIGLRDSRCVSGTDTLIIGLRTILCFAILERAEADIGPDLNIAWLGYPDASIASCAIDILYEARNVDVLRAFATDPTRNEYTVTVDGDLNTDQSALLVAASLLHKRIGDGI
jgi:hypothetical protein